MPECCLWVKEISSITHSYFARSRKFSFTFDLFFHVVLQEEAANNVVEAIETQHFTGTYRNGKYFSRECRIVRCAKNGSELENLSSKMIQFILNDDNN